MEVIDICDAKNCNPKDTGLRIVLNNDNLQKFSMKILYHKDQDFKNFVIHYDFELVNMPVIKVCDKICGIVYDLVKNHNVNIFFSGFPRCVFERFILTPDKKLEFGNNIFFYERDSNNDCGGSDGEGSSDGNYGDVGREESEDSSLDTGDVLENKSEDNLVTNDDVILENSCNKCVYLDDCNFYKKNTFDMIFENVDVLPIYDNSFLVDEFYEIEKKFIDDKSVVEKLDLLIGDFQKEEIFGIKEIFIGKVFAGGFGVIGDMLTYNIYNLSQSFDNNLELLKKVFHDKVLLEDIEDIILNSSLFKLNFFSVDGRAFESLYFDIKNIGSDKIEFLENVLMIELSNNSLGLPVAIEVFSDGNEVIYTKLHYYYESINIVDIKKSFESYGFTSKRNLYKFLNFSLNKPLKGVSISYDYKNGVLESKSINVSFQKNLFKIRFLNKVFDFEMGYLLSRRIVDVTFQIFSNDFEKIFLNYGFSFNEKEEN